MLLSRCFGDSISLGFPIFFAAPMIAVMAERTGRQCSLKASRVSKPRQLGRRQIQAAREVPQSANHGNAPFTWWTCHRDHLQGRIQFGPRDHRVLQASPLKADIAKDKAFQLKSAGSCSVSEMSKQSTRERAAPPPATAEDMGAASEDRRLGEPIPRQGGGQPSSCDFSRNHKLWVVHPWRVRAPTRPVVRERFCASAQGGSRDDTGNQRFTPG